MNEIGGMTTEQMDHVTKKVQQIMFKNTPGPCMSMCILMSIVCALAEFQDYSHNDFMKFADYAYKTNMLVNNDIEVAGMA